VLRGPDLPDPEEVGGGEPVVGGGRAHAYAGSVKLGSAGSTTS
jgi:hypothetical protein